MSNMCKMILGLAPVGCACRGSSKLNGDGIKRHSLNFIKGIADPLRRLSVATQKLQQSDHGGAFDNLNVRGLLMCKKSHATHPALQYSTCDTKTRCCNFESTPDVTLLMMRDT